MLRSLLRFFSTDLAVDLGTANTLILTSDEGIILRQPSVVALDRSSSKVVAVGEEASEMWGKAPGHIRPIRPLRDGVIADFDAAEKMIREFVMKAIPRRFWAPPRMVVGVPYGITPVERRAVRESILRTRVRDVFLVDQPMAAAVGAGLNVTRPSGCCVVDVGGGTTDIAVISLSGIVSGRSLRVAGDEFDRRIINHLRQTRNILIGDRTAEKVKMQIGAAKLNEAPDEMEVTGRGLVNGLATRITVTAAEIHAGLAPSLAELVRELRDVLEQTPPALAADLVENGIVLTGGGGMLRGLDELLADETELEVRVANDPLECVVQGVGQMLDQMDLLSQIALSN